VHGEHDEQDEGVEGRFRPLFLLDQHRVAALEENPVDQQQQTDSQRREQGRQRIVDQFPERFIGFGQQVDEADTEEDPPRQRVAQGEIASAGLLLRDEDGDHAADDGDPEDRQAGEDLDGKRRHRMRPPRSSLPPHDDPADAASP